MKLVLLFLLMGSIVLASRPDLLVLARQRKSA
jgi:hypothetical protein